MAASGSASSNFVGGLIGGIVGGAIGAAIWAAVAYFANLEIGWIAWGVGGLAGLGVLLGGKGALGPVGGVSAVLIALASISAGKYASVHFAIADEEAEIHKQVESIIAQAESNDTVWLARRADEITEEWESKGTKIDWPNAKRVEDREYPDDYPATIRQEAERRWAAVSAEDKDAEKREMAEGLRSSVANEIATQHDQIASAGFVQSWGAMDILFVVLAVLTAFRVGSGTATK